MGLTRYEWEIVPEFPGWAEFKLHEIIGMWVVRIWLWLMCIHIRMRKGKSVVMFGYGPIAKKMYDYLLRQKFLEDV